MEYTINNKTLTIETAKKIFVLDEYDFAELLADFRGTFYGNYSIDRKYQDDKSIFYPGGVKYVSFAESVNYFMPLIVEGFMHDKGDIAGLDNVLIVTAHSAILESLNSL